MLAVAALIGGFIGVVLWFDRVDFYHRHFFDTGAIVAADNVVRIVFVGIFSWLIYAPGAAVAALVTTPAERAALSPAERAVLGFGIGVGIWHVVMLILGVLDLYYRAVMAGLCLVVLVASADISPTSPSPAAAHSPFASPRCGNAAHRRKKSARF